MAAPNRGAFWLIRISTSRGVKRFGNNALSPVPAQKCAPQLRLAFTGCGALKDNRTHDPVKVDGVPMAGVWLPEDRTHIDSLRSQDASCSNISAPSHSMIAETTLKHPSFDGICLIKALSRDSSLSDKLESLTAVTASGRLNSKTSSEYSASLRINSTDTSAGRLATTTAPVILPGHLCSRDVL